MRLGHGGGHIYPVRAVDIGSDLGRQHAGDVHVALLASDVQRRLSLLQGHKAQDTLIPATCFLDCHMHCGDGGAGGARP